MRVAQVSKPDGPFELVERELPEPGPNAVRVAVEACGVCHSDVMVKTAAFPGMALPRVPGHEVVGVVDRLVDQFRLLWRKDCGHVSLSLRMAQSDGFFGAPVERADAADGVERAPDMHPLREHGKIHHGFRVARSGVVRHVFGMLDHDVLAGIER